MIGMSSHIAILHRKYIRLMLQGHKTVESRLTRSTRAPFRKIKSGDRIFFKASSGPFMATAIVRHVDFYDGLTPESVQTLCQQYNDRVCGEDDYWDLKAHSRYASFITLEQVMGTAVGPVMKPSRGLAWFVLSENPALLLPFVFTLTAGALKNGYVSACGGVPRSWAGGRTRDERGTMLTIRFSDQRSDPQPGQKPGRLSDRELVETDVTASGLFRWRRWKSCFSAHGLTPGDQLIFEPVAPLAYRVHFQKQNIKNASDKPMSVNHV